MKSFEVRAITIHMPVEGKTVERLTVKKVFTVACSNKTGIVEF